jgi:hypothetical protein
MILIASFRLAQRIECGVVLANLLDGAGCVLPAVMDADKTPA